MLSRSPGPHCVWMHAGVIRFRLCNRAFDCEHCPLDAALCGRPVPNQQSSPSAPPRAEEDGLRAPRSASIEDILNTHR